MKLGEGYRLDPAQSGAPVAALPEQLRVGSSSRLAEPGLATLLVQDREDEAQV